MEGGSGAIANVDIGWPEIEERGFNDGKRCRRTWLGTRLMVDGVTSPAPRRFLVSFDIDGTLEVGQPPGPIALELVRHVQRRGHLIGSCSDRTLGEQRAMWNSKGIEFDFVSHKHQLEALRSEFDCTNFVHIGDTITDLEFAAAANFEFWYATDLSLTNPEDVILGEESPANEHHDPSPLSSR